MTDSPFNLRSADSLRVGEMEMRPVLSISHSCAGAMIRRCNRRVFDLNMDDEAMILSEIFLHSSGGKSHRHLSTPRVNTIFSPAISFRKREGNISRPFSSTE